MVVDNQPKNLRKFVLADISIIRSVCAMAPYTL